MSLTGHEPLVVFALGEQKFAVSISMVERVVRAVEITPLPDAPANVRGVINFQGRIVPVFDLWRRCGLPPRALHASDYFIIAQTRSRLVVLWVDSVDGVESVDGSAFIPAADFAPELDLTRGVMELPTGLVLVQDLDRFLSAAEDETLRAALEPN
ncbi:MAG: chemotaxis protein CheW [Chthoniobacteraceae bacterium]